MLNLESVVILPTLNYRIKIFITYKSQLFLQLIEFFK